MIGTTQGPIPDKSKHSHVTKTYDPAGFEPTVPASEQPEAYALNRAAFNFPSKLVGIFPVSYNILPIRKNLRSVEHIFIELLIFVDKCRLLLKKDTNVEHLISRHPYVLVRTSRVTT